MSFPSILDSLRVGTTTDFDALGGQLLVQQGAVTGVAQPVLTCGQNQRILILTIMLANTTGTAEVVTIYHNDVSGGVAAAANMIYHGSVGANSTNIVYGPIATISTGGRFFIQTAAVDDAVTCSFYGGYHDVAL